MDVHDINPSNFPAKLWRLVNQPGNQPGGRAIRWDPSGDCLIIHQHLFQKHFLTHPHEAPGSVALFKTTNFTSFIRQLNLYGFKKVMSSRLSGVDGPVVAASGLEHYFRHPHFCRSRPELLVNLRRLTSSNKAKLYAGLEVNCRPPKRYHQPRAVNTEETVEERSGSLLCQTQLATACINTPSRPLPIKEYSRTTIPCSWMMTDGNTPCIPISVPHRYPGEVSSPATVHLQQGAHALANPGQRFYNLIPHTPQYTAACYFSAFDYHLQSPVSSDITGTGNRPSQYQPHLSYYQPNGPVGLMYPSNYYHDWQRGEKQDQKKNDVNLDAVFQIIEEFQSGPKVCLVKVVTPEKRPATIHSSTWPPSSQAKASSSTLEVQPQAVWSPYRPQRAGKHSPRDQYGAREGGDD